MRLHLFFSIFIFANVCFASIINPDVIRKNSVPIIGVNDDVVIVASTPLVRVGDLVVIARIKDDDIEVISRGSVENIQDGKFLILLDSKTITKFPKVRDRVVSLARLQEKKYDEPEVPPIGGLQPDEPDPYEQGYVQLDFGPYQGKIESASPNQANQYKTFEHNFMDTHLMWYFDFLWRIGLEYRSSGGSVPVKSYNREEKQTTYRESMIAIHYRFLPIWKELRPTLKLVTKSTDFKTANDDEYVLSSAGSGMGLGANFHYLFGPNIFNSEKSFDWSFNRIYFDLTYFPSYSMKDSGVTRGDSSTGTAMELSLGATTLVHMGFIPFFKRFSVDVSTGMSSSQVTFSGAPTNAPDGFYSIPEGGTYKESQNFIRIMIGLRMEDYVGKMLKPR
ncbi:hypothetical protein predicted by Glimmer/Critica [Bdellovibrio bacteriovorus HD100]|uniref:Uncharacterized protein n=1 Tax=Bdellovibrio bacteriovorus (strain ATCC 15356 / DSM 50701 / NCIMB 9529 / HD100) TaxID=264462 RepID=Q6MIX0_BDEBA|nr:hypothetical protein predicted by Glimmer/Critica [Bdellovibrio bacteriovorus HD100]